MYTEQVILLKMLHTIVSARQWQKGWFLKSTTQVVTVGIESNIKRKLYLNRKRIDTQCKGWKERLKQQEVWTSWTSETQVHKQ